MKKLKLLDTFAGIGGFSYAAEKLVGGFETTQFVEIDPYCQKILKKHWPHLPIHDDITTFTARPFQYDIICGGFPCQDISTAGRKEGITEKSRSGLFYELIRIIRLVRPKYVVMENVAAILNRGLDIVLRELSEAGYNAEWSVISASSLGAAHRRSRWWLIAYPNCVRCRGRNSKGCSVQKWKFLQGKQTGSEMGSEVERCSINNFRWRNTEHRLNSNWRQYASKPTLCRGDDGLSNRVDRLKSLGNSVVVQVAAIPLQRVLDIEKNKNN